MSGVIPNRNSGREAFPVSRSPPPQENQQVIMEILNYCKVKYNIDESAHKSLSDLVGIIINEKQFYKDMYERTKDQSVAVKLLKDNYSSVVYRGPSNAQSSRRLEFQLKEDYSSRNLQANLQSVHEIIGSTALASDDKTRISQLQGMLDRCTKEVQAKVYELFEAHNTISNLQRELKNAQQTIEAQQKILSKTGTRIIKTQVHPLTTIKKTSTSISVQSRSRSNPLSSKFGNSEPVKLRTISREPMNTRTTLQSSKVDKPVNRQIDPPHLRSTKLNIPVKPQSNLLTSRRGLNTLSPSHPKMKLSNDKRSKRSEITLSPKSSSRILMNIAKNPYLNQTSETHIPLLNSKSLDKRKVSSIAPLRKLTDPSIKAPYPEKKLIQSLVEIRGTSIENQLVEKNSKGDDFYFQEKQKLESVFLQEKSNLLEQLEKEKALLIERHRLEREALISNLELQKSEVINLCTERENDRIMELKSNFVRDMQMIRQKHLLLEDECRLLRQKLTSKLGEEKASQTESEITLALLSSEIAENGINSVVQEKDYLLNKYRRKLLRSEKELRVRDKQLNSLKSKLVSELESRSEVFDQLTSQISVFESALVTLTSEKKV
jgi:hypothetical protein